MPTVEDIRARWADRIEHGKRCDRSNALDAHDVQDLFDALEATRADRDALRAQFTAAMSAIDSMLDGLKRKIDEACKARSYLAIHHYDDQREIVQAVKDRVLKATAGPAPATVDANGGVVDDPAKRPGGVTVTIDRDLLDDFREKRRAREAAGEEGDADYDNAWDHMLEAADALACAVDAAEAWATASTVAEALVAAVERLKKTHQDAEAWRLSQSDEESMDRAAQDTINAAWWRGNDQAVRSITRAVEKRLGVPEGADDWPGRYQRVLKEIEGQRRRLRLFETCGGLGAKPIRIDYTNHRGERAWRTVTPNIVFWGADKFHPRPQWLLSGYDREKNAGRAFAVDNIHAIEPFGEEEKARP